MNIIILLGPAGSGKGTQSKYIQTEYNYFHISTGDLLRNEVASHSTLGQKVRSVIESGNLVSDDIILDIIKENLNKISEDKSNKGVVFDGFPRTLDQAKGLDTLLAQMSREVSGVLHFELPLDECVHRISGRRIDSRNNNVYHIEYNPAPEEAAPFLQARDDDSPEKVKHRYTVFEQETTPLLAYYKEKLTAIDCMKSIESINQQIKQTLNNVTCING
jgi:adenylate kinase